MRISDWSSDVCSSDLLRLGHGRRGAAAAEHGVRVVESQIFHVPGGMRIRQSGATEELDIEIKEVDPRTVELRASGYQCAEIRSEERRVGKECVSTCESRWLPDH